MKIRRKHAPVAVLALLLAAGSLSADPQAPTPLRPAAQPSPEPGLWEVTVRLDVPGGPVRNARQMMRHCYTREDLADLRRTIPRAGPECEVSDFRLEGNRATWNLKCSGSDVVAGSGEMILGRHAYAANIWNEISERGRTLRVTQRIRARRLGECLAGEPGPGAKPGAQSPPSPPPR